MKKIIVFLFLLSAAVNSQSVKQSDNIFNSPRLLFGYGVVSFFKFYENKTTVNIYHIGSVKFIRPIGNKFTLNAAIDFAAGGYKNYEMFHLGAGYKLLESNKFCGYVSVGGSAMGSNDGLEFATHLILSAEYMLSQNHTIGLDLRNFIGENYAFSPVIYISLNVGRKNK
jgi:hypothetical protein